jgi:hypothetical protein
MQIILVQHEIEQALKMYLGQRLTITEGTEINIDLAATRGSEGTKAIIDLIPAAPATVATTGKSNMLTNLRQPRTKSAIPAASTKDVPDTSVMKVQKVEVSESETVQEAEPEVVEAEAEPTEAEAEADDPEPVEEVVADPPAAAAPVTATPVKSLFANLRKPTNV